jgi:phospholipid-transporting ATPase
LDAYIFTSPNEINWFISFISRVGTWILIFTNLVPISLLVTMEMIKYIQGMFISWDINIYDVEKDIPTFVQTSTLNEELGQVKVNINKISISSQTKPERLPKTIWNSIK